MSGFMRGYCRWRCSALAGDIAIASTAIARAWAGTPKHLQKWDSPQFALEAIGQAHGTC